jgi:predicted Rossmann fold nucleotide-binding protein DprA/Smf involved in DNA uptake
VTGKEDKISETARALEASYQDVQYAFVQFFTEHLVDCGQAFDRDFSAVLIMAVLGQRRLASVRTGQQFDESNLSQICMSASRIADVVGLPRQTVRRKLSMLEARGWIAEHPGVGWYVAGPDGEVPVRAVMSGLEKRQFLRLAKLHARLSEILEKQGD